MVQSKSESPNAEALRREMWVRTLVCGTLGKMQAERQRIGAELEAEGRDREAAYETECVRVLGVAMRAAEDELAKMRGAP